MKEYHPPLGDRSGLRLDFNENTLAPSPKVAEALQAISSGALTKYPERTPVEALVAAKLGLRSAQVLLTNGVDEAVNVLFSTWLDAGDRVLMPVPTYSMYEVYASGLGAEMVRVPSTDGFHFPYEALLAAITPATRVIALANPNNPTGSPVPREQILTLVERAPQAIVLADEAYFHFHGETVLDQLDTYPNLVVARTFSKAYGLAGLRIGVLAAQEATLAWMRRVISPYSVNALALACLPPALEDDAYLNWYVSEAKASRAELGERLTALGVEWWPSEANFVLARIGPKHREFVQAMHRRGVLVRDRSADPGCDGWVRITAGTLEQMRTSFAALEEALGEIS